jgi:hypothetical protein
MRFVGFISLLKPLTLVGELKLSEQDEHECMHAYKHIKDN